MCVLIVAGGGPASPEAIEERVWDRKRCFNQRKGARFPTVVDGAVGCLAVKALVVALFQVVDVCVSECVKPD